MITNILEKASDVIWMKVDREGGRKGKGDRTRREVCGKGNGGDTRRHGDRKGGRKVRSKWFNQTFIQNNCVFRLQFHVL